MTKPWHGEDAPADPVKRATIGLESNFANGGFHEMKALVGDLAALCEELSTVGFVGPEQPRHQPEVAKAIRASVMANAHNPNGTRRWPGLREE